MGKHLHGALHGHKTRQHRLAVETIGFHVVDCTEELAVLDNASVRRALENEYKSLNQLYGRGPGGKQDFQTMPTERVADRDSGSRESRHWEARQRNPIQAESKSQPTSVGVVLREVAKGREDLHNHGPWLDGPRDVWVGLQVERYRIL